MKTYNINNSILDLRDVVLALQIAKGNLKNSTAVHTTAGLHMVDQADQAIYNAIDNIRNIIANMHTIQLNHDLEYTKRLDALYNLLINKS